MDARIKSGHDRCALWSKERSVSHTAHADFNFSNSQAIPDTQFQTQLRDLAARCARALQKSSAPRRAWGMRVARSTRSPLCNVESTGVEATGTPERPAFPHAMVLTAYVVLSPVTGLFCHRHPQSKVLSLSPVGPTELRELD